MKTLAKILLALLLVVAGTLAVLYQPDLPLEDLKARWATPPSQFIEVAGMQVHIRDEGPRGDPVPVLLLHGTSASLHTWDGWAAALQAQRRVIRVDMPGFGLTGPAASGDYSIPAYVRFVKDLLDALQVKQVTLGGNSLGGHIAWETAVAHPDRVAQLILVDAGGYAFTPESMPIGFTIARTPVLNKVMEFTLPRAMVESSVRNVYGDPSKVTDALVDRYWQLTLRAGNRHALAQRFRFLPDGSTAHLISTIRQPTLVIWGDQDRLIPPSNGDDFVRDIPGARLVVFPGLGHVPHEEDPQATVAAVLAFPAPVVLDVPGGAVADAAAPAVPAAP